MTEPYYALVEKSAGKGKYSKKFGVFSFEQNANFTSLIAVAGAETPKDLAAAVAVLYTKFEILNRGISLCKPSQFPSIVGPSIDSSVYQYEEMNQDEQREFIDSLKAIYPQVSSAPK